MSGRIENARTAFTEIFDKDLWGLGRLPPHTEFLKHFACVVQKTVRQHNVTSVVDFGCGHWSYAALVDWSGVTYDGYDVVPGAAERNANLHGSSTVNFHPWTEETELPAADMLICKDVLQHLPVDDVHHYLAMFKRQFPYILIINDILPDDNLNGDIAPGGHRSLRLDLPPFNEQSETVDDYDFIAFGVDYRKRASLLRGTRPVQTAIVSRSSNPDEKNKISRVVSKLISVIRGLSFHGR